MQVHRQRCQACQSIQLHNLLVREPGQPQVVIVRCAQCKALVARYELDRYYHHKKGFESWLASYRGATESGRALLDRFRTVQNEAIAQFDRVVALLVQQGKD